MIVHRLVGNDPVEARRTVASGLDVAHSLRYQRIGVHHVVHDPARIPDAVQGLNGRLPRLARTQGNAGGEDHHEATLAGVFEDQGPSGDGLGNAPPASVPRLEQARCGPARGLWARHIEPVQVALQVSGIGPVHRAVQIQVHQGRLAQPRGAVGRQLDEVARRPAVKPFIDKQHEQDSPACGAAAAVAESRHPLSATPCVAHVAHGETGLAGGVAEILDRRPVFVQIGGRLTVVIDRGNVIGIRELPKHHLRGRLGGVGACFGIRDVEGEVTLAAFAQPTDQQRPPSLARIGGRQHHKRVLHGGRGKQHGKMAPRTRGAGVKPRGESLVAVNQLVRHVGKNFIAVGGVKGMQQSIVGVDVHHPRAAGPSGRELGVGFAASDGIGCAIAAHGLGRPDNHRLRADNRPQPPGVALAALPVDLVFIQDGSLAGIEPSVRERQARPSGTVLGDDDPLVRRGAFEPSRGSPQHTQSVLIEAHGMKIAGCRIQVVERPIFDATLAG